MKRFKIKKNLSHQLFGDLLVLDEYEFRGHRIYWKCRCSCGKEKYIYSWNLISGKAKTCGCSSERVTRELRILNTKRHFNHNFFNLPNELNSYWAGFISADGCIVHGNSLVIGLHTKDRTILENFCDSICLDKQFIKDTTDIHYKVLRKVSTIHLVSEQFIKDLKNNFNITARKTFTLIPPNIKDLDLILSYIAGYIDGDGGFYLYGNSVCVSLMGTKALCDWIKNILNSLGIYVIMFQQHKMYVCKFSTIGISTFIEYLNFNKLPLLKRKWEKVIDELL